MQYSVVSFGYKNGMPSSTTFTIDCRVLKNPASNPELAKLRGIDEPVAMSVRENIRWSLLFNYALATALSFANENRRKLVTIGIGCTSGHHRSVVLAESLSKELRNNGHIVQTQHRDLTKP